MIKKKIVLFLLLGIIVTTPVCGINDDIQFHTANTINVRKQGLHNPRTPVKRPTASISNHTLYIQGCNGCILQLISDNDIVYTTVISGGTVELPEEFTGTFRIEIIRGDYCFWAEIEL